LDTLESIEVAIEKIQKNLHNLQAEVPAFYVWGENPDTTDALLKVSSIYIITRDKFHAYRIANALFCACSHN
jgi:hypothetical protein